MLYRIQKGQVPKITHLPVAKVEQMKLLSHQRQLLITSSLPLILKTCKLNTHMSNAIKKSHRPNDMVGDDLTCFLFHAFSSSFSNEFYKSTQSLESLVPHITKDAPPYAYSATLSDLLPKK